LRAKEIKCFGRRTVKSTLAFDPLSQVVPKASLILDAEGEKLQAA